MPLDSYEKPVPVPDQPGPSPAQRAFIWWVIWFAILSGSIVIYAVIRSKGAPPATTSALAFLGVGPLAISMVLRWLVMPGVTQRGKGFVIFVIGLSMSEGATILATFLGSGQMRDAIAVLGILGVATWAPVFAARMLEDGTR